MYALTVNDLLLGLIALRSPWLKDFRISGLQNHIGLTHRPHSSSFLGLPYRILNMNPKKELLRGLWVVQLRRGMRASCNTKASTFPLPGPGGWRFCLERLFYDCSFWCNTRLWSFCGLQGLGHYRVSLGFTAWGLWHTRHTLFYETCLDPGMA